MKPSSLFVAALLAVVAFHSAYAQGTFVYDQQSSTDDYIPPYGAGQDMQQIPPTWGQSFTPSLARIDFVRLKIAANSVNAGLANMYLNLHSDSIDGPILGTTDPVSLVTGFRGNPNFFFPTTVALTPGVTYYFESVIQVYSGLWRITVGNYKYAGGSAYAASAPDVPIDLWFREGTYDVPEPASGLLLLLGAGTIAVLRRSRS